jgi:hypothetical protein
MLDSDNVLLLHVARPDSGLDSGNRPRPAKGASEVPRRLVVANIYSFAGPVGAEFLDFFDRRVKPELQKAGATVRGSYLSETSPNNFPRLPIREKENVFVWFASFADQSEYEQSLARLARSAPWRMIDRALKTMMKGEPEVLRLQPTSRSSG